MNIQKNFPVGIMAWLYSMLTAMEPFRGKVISPGFLRQSVALDNQSDTLEFDFYSSDRIAEYPDSKLQDKDVFVSAQMALCLAKVNTQKVGAEVLHAYPNKEVFTLTGVTPEDLEALYNGHVSVQIDQTEVITRHMARLHREVPETYTEATNLDLTQDSYNGVPGLRDLPFSLMLNGKQQTNIRWKFPKFNGAQMQTTATNTEVRAIMIHNGFFIKGAAEAHYKYVDAQKRGI